MSLAVQIMKSDEDVRMISAEAPVLFAKVGALLGETFCTFWPLTAAYMRECAQQTNKIDKHRENASWC